MTPWDPVRPWKARRREGAKAPSTGHAATRGTTGHLVEGAERDDVHLARQNLQDLGRNGGDSRQALHVTNGSFHGVEPINPNGRMACGFEMV